MLDVQRYKGATYRKEVHFTRMVIWVHLGLGAIVALLLLLHQLLNCAMVVGGWYFLTLLLVIGMSHALEISRLILGLTFLLFTVGGIYFLGQVLPHLKPETPPLISYVILPFWLGLTNIIYAAAGLCLLFHQNPRRACSIGFSIW